MPWLWNSWEEYKLAVNPVAAQSPGLFSRTKVDSWFGMASRIFAASEKLRKNAEQLKTLGFGRHKIQDPSEDDARIGQAWQVVLEATYAGEELLLHHKRLATDRDKAYGFLHSHDLIEHWDRYKTEPRIYYEVHQFLVDIEKLLKGYDDLATADEEFLLRDLDLPESLESDFRLARNLFSVGFDEIGLLIAGRGLEGVLREIARIRKIFIAHPKKGISPAAEADVFDLIEAMYHLTWKKTGHRLIPPETKALLHYLRTLRNSTAHPARKRMKGITPREQGVVAAATANSLWREVTGTRARLEPTTVLKNW